jgi:hypothetical protein
MVMVMYVSVVVEILKEVPQFKVQRNCQSRRMATSGGDLVDSPKGESSFDESF